MLFDQMKSIKEKVEHLLVKHPELRDDDYRLIANFYAKEIGKRLNNLSATQFLIEFANGNLPHTESIRRVRAKLQEDNPLLRGENYGKRKGAGESTARKISGL